MPHFGLIDDKIGPLDEMLMRARLHLRCGRRRLIQKKTSLGILTLYDAINSAMQWYIMHPENRNKLKQKEGEDTRDDSTAFTVLRRSQVIKNDFEYDAFNRLAGDALTNDFPDYDYKKLLNGIESVMTELGVMPFDEKDLPPEDPSTP